MEVVAWEGPSSVLTQRKKILPSAFLSKSAMTLNSFKARMSHRCAKFGQTNKNLIPIASFSRNYVNISRITRVYLEKEDQCFTSLIISREERANVKCRWNWSPHYIYICDFHCRTVATERLWATAQRTKYVACILPLLTHTLEWQRQRNVNAVDSRIPFSRLLT